MGYFNWDGVQSFSSLINSSNGHLTIDRSGNLQFWNARQTEYVYSTIRANQWYHFAASGNSEGIWRLMLNGVVVASGQIRDVTTVTTDAIFGDRFFGYIDTFSLFKYDLDTQFLASYVNRIPSWFNPVRNIST